MNIFTKWLEKNRRADDKKKHKTAMGIALALTMIVVYFIAYSWYSTLVNTIDLNAEGVSLEPSYNK
jgi:uncharacterized membrane protein YozB (DUF420 family)